MKNNKCILCQDSLMHYNIKKSYEYGLLYSIKENQICKNCNCEIIIRNDFKNNGKKSINILINETNNYYMICMINLIYDKDEMSYMKNIWIGFDYFNLKINTCDFNEEYAIKEIKKIYSNMIFE